MVVTVSRLRVCAGMPPVGSPCLWPVGPGVGVHLVTVGSMDMGLLLCLWLCLSTLCSSSRGCKYRAVLRSVCRICLSLSLPSLGRPSRSRAGARSGLPLWFGLVHYSPNLRGRACRLCYPRPVLFPPSCWSSGFPIILRAVGYHRLRPRPTS